MLSQLERRAFRRLKLERRRLSICIDTAVEMRRPDLIYLASHYLRRLTGFTALLPTDAVWIDGQIGRNGLRPALDDVARQVRLAKRCLTPRAVPAWIDLREAA